MLGMNITVVVRHGSRTGQVRSATGTDIELIWRTVVKVEQVEGDLKHWPRRSPIIRVAKKNASGFSARTNRGVYCMSHLSSPKPAALISDPSL